ncbi:MAG: hypothetical protein ACJAS4_003150 [Bacteriovoracaceae bacterium]|jgi:hypothetical protein
MNLSDKNNYYEVLEVSTNSTLQDIHSAYIRAKNAYSGDSAALYSLMSQDECDSVLNQIEEAYSILGIPEKRREYDKVRGLNQTHTPEGFVEEISKKPDYKPHHSLSDMLSEPTNTHNEIIQENALKEEFKYQQEHSAKTQASVSKIQAFKKFGLNYEQDTSFEQEIENCTVFTGEFLNKIREYKKVTIERMAEMTKISKTYIRNIEGDEFSKLPADVYTRGFVYQYAKCLKLNSDLVATSYIHHLRQLKNPV